MKNVLSGLYLLSLPVVLINTSAYCNCPLHLLLVVSSKLLEGQNMCLVEFIVVKICSSIVFLLTIKCLSKDCFILLDLSALGRALTSWAMGWRGIPREKVVVAHVIRVMGIHQTYHSGFHSVLVAAAREACVDDTYKNTFYHFVICFIYLVQIGSLSCIELFKCTVLHWVVQVRFTSKTLHPLTCDM